MNNVIIHAPDGDEYNTDAYIYYADSCLLKFHNLVNANWLVIDDVDITIDVTGFLIEITCTYSN